MVELIHELLPALRRQQGWSVSVLSRKTVHPGDPGIGEKTIEAIERSPGRVPEARIIEALAQALGEVPERFYEYPIAAARRAARPGVSSADDEVVGVLEAEARQRDHQQTSPAPASKRKKS